MIFQEYASESRKLIENHLKQILQTQKELLPQSLQKQKIIESLEDFVFKGKLIRGTLYLLTIEMFGGPVTKKHLDIACAIELVHSSLLIQDDIIDNDYIRRGGKTIFAVYEEKGHEVEAIDAKHFGLSIALLVADVSFYLAMELISNYDSDVVGKMMKYFSQEITKVALAEGIDSEFGQTKVEATKDEIIDIYTYKTARYTFSLPLVLACLALKKDDKTLKEIDTLGEYVGTIFQIKDDLIGLMGDEKEIGKPVGSDVRENKKTLVRFLLFEKVDDDEKNTIKRLFGNEKFTREDLEYIKDLVSKYKIIDILDSDMKVIMDKAWIIFNNLNANNDKKEILKNLFLFNLNRTA